jgi:hypothetical protein
LESITIESVGHILKYIGGTGSPSVGDNFVLPNPQESHEIGFACLAGAPLGQPMSEEGAKNTAANAPAKKADDYRYYVGHLMVGVAGGAFGEVVEAFG